MSTVMLILLLVALAKPLSVVGQSTLDSCWSSGQNFGAGILDEIKYTVDRMQVCSCSCSKIEQLLIRHLTFSKHPKDTHIPITWPRDCADIAKVGQNVSDVYQVSTYGPGFVPIEISVYCDMNSLNSSWLVFQRRKDGSENFERTWIEYRNGFGNLRGEFWLGNNALHFLTSNRNYKLRIDLEDFDGNKGYAEYAQFAVGSAADSYRLNVSGYAGNAGDSLAFHNGLMFSTMDADNDNRTEYSCAQRYRGAWWYNYCHHSNLNGRYLRGNYSGQSHADGAVWGAFRGHQYSLKVTEMKIAPKN